MNDELKEKVIQTIIDYRLSHLIMDIKVEEEVQAACNVIADWLENKDGKGFKSGFSSYENEALKAAKQLRDKS